MIMILILYFYHRLESESNVKCTEMHICNSDKSYNISIYIISYQYYFTTIKQDNSKRTSDMETKDINTIEK